MKNFLVLMGIVMIVYPIGMFAQNRTLTKKVDFSSQIKYVTQEQAFWCVYACLEATSNNGKQCDFCSDFVTRYVLPDYESGFNPYLGLMTSESLKEVMERYKNENSNPCSNSSEYSDFGVIGSQINTYLGDYGYKRMMTMNFIKALSDVNITLSSPVLLVSGTSTGHAVVFYLSELYNNDWNNSQSVIFVYDPALGQSRLHTMSSFQQSFIEIFN